MDRQAYNAPSKIQNWDSLQLIYTVLVLEEIHIPT